MKKIERIAKKFGCDESRVSRAIAKVALIKAEVSRDSDDWKLIITEREIYEELMKYGLKINSVPKLSLLKIK